MKPILAVITAALLLSACKGEVKKDTEQPPAQTTPATSQPATSQPATSQPEEQPAAQAPATADQTATAKVSRSAIEPTLMVYETIREALAGDDLAAVPEAAKKLADAAKKPSGSKHLQAIAAASEKLAKEDPAKPDEVRKAFGEVSRHLVALLESSAELHKGLHVFECPMAQGYKKWVQPNDAIENPYMGKKMLQCGSEVDWAS